MFDRVLKADSSLLPAVIHQLNLAVLYRDRDQYYRSRRIFDRYAPREHRQAEDVAAAIVWGPRPPDTAFATAMSQRYRAAPALALGSIYRRPDATSDTVLALFRWAARAGPRSPEFELRGLMERAYGTVGLGRLQEALPIIDSLIAISPGAGAGAIAGPIGLGIAPPTYGGDRLQKLMATAPPGAMRQYGHALWT